MLNELNDVHSNLGHKYYFLLLPGALLLLTHKHVHRLFKAGNAAINSKQNSIQYQGSKTFSISKFQAFCGLLSRFSRPYLSSEYKQLDTFVHKWF